MVEDEDVDVDVDVAGVDADAGMDSFTICKVSAVTCERVCVTILVQP